MQCGQLLWGFGSSLCNSVRKDIAFSATFWAVCTVALWYFFTPCVLGGAFQAMIVLPLSRSGPETGRLFLSAQNSLVGIMLLHVWAAGAFHGFWSFCDNDGQWKESVVSVCARFRTALRTEQWSRQVWRLALDQLVLPVASRVVFSVALPSCVAFVLCQVYGPRDGTIQDEHVQHYLVNWFPSFQWSDAFVFFLACFRAIVVLMLIVAIMTCLYRPLKSWFDVIHDVARHDKYVVGLQLHNKDLAADAQSSNASETSDQGRNGFVTYKQLRQRHVRPQA